MNDSRNETSKAIKPIKLLEGKNDKLFKLKTSIFFFFKGVSPESIFRVVL